MAQFSLTLRISSDDLERKLAEIIKKMNAPAPLYRNIGEYLVRQTQRVRFNSETDPDGVPWAPLAPSTLRRKRKIGAIMKTLQERGNLRRSIAYQADSQGVAVGSNLKYAALHQFGGEVRSFARTTEVGFKLDGQGVGRFAKRSKATIMQPVTYGGSVRRIPARPFLGVGDDDEVAIVEMIADYLLG